MHRRRRLPAFAALLALAATTAGAQDGARAPFLAEVTRSDLGDRQEVLLQFTAPALYLDHSPRQLGEQLQVVLQYGITDEHERPLWREARQLPASGPWPRLSLKVDDDPRCAKTARPVCLHFELGRALQYTVRPGSDGRSLLVTLSLPSDAPGKE